MSMDKPESLLHSLFVAMVTCQMCCMDMWHRYTHLLVAHAHAHAQNVDRYH